MMKFEVQQINSVGNSTFIVEKDGSLTPAELIIKPRVKQLSDGILVYRSEEWEPREPRGAIK